MDLGKCPSCGVPWVAGSEKCTSCGHVPIGAGLKGRPVEKKKARNWWEPVPEDENKIEAKPVVVDLGKCPRCSTPWVKGETRCAVCKYESLGTEAVRVIQKREPKPKQKEKVWKPLPSLGIPTAIVLAACGVGGFYLVKLAPKDDWSKRGNSSLAGIIAIDPTYDPNVKEGDAFGVGLPFKDAAESPHAGPHEDFAVLASQPERFRVSPSGTTVTFASSRGKTDAPWMASFSLADRNIHTGSLEGSVEAPNRDLPIANLDGTPTLAGKALQVDGEHCHSFAVAADGTFVLGCDHTVRKFKADGSPLWVAETRHVVLSLNVAKEGGMLIAAFDDGTLRWIRYDDGHELMILCVKQGEGNFGGTKWALWTHEGYFDCSPNGGNIAGINVSGGAKAPSQFYCLSCFRDSYYRPDVIQRILKTKNVAQAVAEANTDSNRTAPAPIEKLYPPIVHITNDPVADAQGKTSIAFSVKSHPGDTIEQVVVQVDGRPVKSLKDVALDPSTGEASRRVDIEMERGSTVTVVAKNERAWSMAESKDVSYKGKDGNPIGASQSGWKAMAPPTLYVLAVGVNRTATKFDDLPSLKLPERDAADFLKAIDPHHSKLFPNFVPILLNSERATVGAIRDAIASVVAKAKRHDVIVIFLSGHGVSDSNFDYRFVPFDYDPQHPKETSITEQDLAKVTESQANVLMFIDTCHAARVTQGRVSNDINKTIDAMSSAEHGAIVYSACSGAQEAIESDLLRNGLFTSAVVDGLRGKADRGHEGKVMTDSIAAFVRQRVSELASKIVGNPDAQTPCVSRPSTVQDFAITLVAKPPVR